MVRFDGRKDDEYRKLDAKIGIIPNADGSAMFKMGNTVAIAGVVGPREMIPRHARNADKAVLRCYYYLGSFSVTERARPGPNRRSIELSMKIKEALEPVINLEKFPNSVIDVYIYITQADAGTRCVALNAASLALADAGVPMKDIISAVAVGKVGERVVVDLTKKEEDYGHGTEPNKYYGKGGATDLPIAYSEVLDKITLIQMDGGIGIKDFKQAIEKGIKSCKEIRKFQQKILKDKYENMMKNGKN